MGAHPYQQDFAYAGNAYGVNPEVLDAIARLESNYTAGAKNDWDINARNGTPSEGLMQFIKPTFDAYARHAREANPEAWRGVPMDWHNPRAQILATAWAIKNGHGSAWATFDRAKAGAKYVTRKPGGVAPMPTAASRTYAPASVPDSKTAALEFVMQGSPFEGLATQMAASAPQATPKPPAAPQSTGGGLGGFYRRRSGETGQQFLDRILQHRFGLKHDPGNAQTTGGRHAEGSDHYRGTATDYGDGRNPASVLQEAEDWLEQNADRFGIKQVIYGANEDPNHADHMHASTYRSGGYKGAHAS